jgi:thiol:disulfide interchange protein DsbD
MKTGSGILGLVIAVGMMGSFVMQGPGVRWQTYSDRLLNEAIENQKPVIIDFSAAWCAPCRKMDEVTFHDREVVKQAEQDFVMIKVDLTRKGNAGNERLLQKYDVKGVPTIVFLDRQGKERQDLRLVDFLPAEQFLVRMAESKKM